MRKPCGTTWQIADITQYCDIKFDGDHQTVGDLKKSPVKRLVVVFVSINDDGDDRFYVLTWRSLRHVLVKHHRSYLELHDGVRPKRWDSLHCGVSEEHLRPYRDKWEIVDKNLG